MVVSFTDDVDVSGRGKRIASWSWSSSAATTLNFRRGSLAGAIVFQAQIPITTSVQQSYMAPLYVAEGWFIEVVGAGAGQGCVDVI